MSQNQSYFWQTTRHNVYLKRSAKFHVLMALVAVLAVSTVCLAETEPKFNEDEVTMGAPTKLTAEEIQFAKSRIANDAANDLPSNNDATKDTAGATKSGQSGFIDAFTASISVILFTELGDKTFFIAAIMAMRHPRLIVFAGAITALALMTVLSVVFGMAATIIPKIYTYYISTALFAIFGLKMIYDGYFMSATDAQEELEEVQSDLRKREDELLRTRSKHDDSDTKRKNSNSDKDEEADEERSAGAANTPHSNANNNPTTMKHRQRKQLNNNFNNSINNNLNKNGCETNNGGDDGAGAEHNEETDVFLNGQETLKMSIFHSSPALALAATSAATSPSNQIQNCDEFNDSTNLNINNNSGETQQHKKRNNNMVNGGPTTMVHSASAAADFTNSKAIITRSNGSIAGAGATNTSITNGLSSLSLNSAAGQSNGELKQIGGSKKRLERDVSATLIQDPESGIVRRNSKKTATYFTTRVLMQAFTMTFLAEWGDRSQLTTIILAASKDVYGVIVGGVLGHSICTGIAVIGGRIVAAKISVRTVTILGGIVFLGFAVYALLVRPDDI